MFWYTLGDSTTAHTEYTFDLQLGLEFVPTPCDGEVMQFYLWDIKEVKEHLLNHEFTPESGAVILDFLIRHSYITPDNEPDYLAILNELRVLFQFPSPKFCK